MHEFIPDAILKLLQNTSPRFDGQSMNEKTFADCMKPIQSLLLCAPLALAFVLHSENSTNDTRRIGPVPPSPTTRPPFASEVEEVFAPGGKGVKSLLPGLPLETGFPCLKWIPQGPGLSTNGDANILPDHQTAGGVSAIAPHPTDSNILYIGTVNGGVWRTDNATSNSVTWTPLTDDQLSLSIGGLALDPTDASGQTLVAGIGRRSSFSGVGGAQIGLLRTINGGAS